MKPEDTKTVCTISGPSWLDSFLKEDWILIGREEKKTEELIVTHYTVGHFDPKKALPRDYAAFIKMAVETRTRH